MRQVQGRQGSAGRRSGQACPQIGAPGYDPFSAEGANRNLVIGNAAIDPIGGSVVHRSYLC